MSAMFSDTCANQEKKLKQIRITLKERLDTLKTLDEEILELIEADEEISTEIEEAGKYRESVHEMIVNIDSLLEAKPITGGPILPCVINLLRYIFI